MSREYELVIAPEGKLAETIRELLELAERPQDVMPTGSSLEIHVPAYLAEAYVKSKKPRRKRAQKEEEE